MTSIHSYLKHGQIQRYMCGRTRTPLCLPSTVYRWTLTRIRSTLPPVLPPALCPTPPGQTVPLQRPPQPTLNSPSWRTTLKLDPCVQHWPGRLYSRGGIGFGLWLPGGGALRAKLSAPPRQALPPPSGKGGWGEPALAPRDKSLAQGMTFNRSQRGSCSATHETLTQNQVVYE